MDQQAWEKRHQRRDEHRAQRKQQQKKILTVLMIVTAVALTGILVLTLVRRGMQQQSPSVDVDATAGVEATVDSSKTVIHLAVAGDVNITDRVVAAGGMDYDYTRVFMDVAPILSTADLAVVNFEGNLSGAPYGTSTGSAPQNLVQALDRAGVDLVQLANSYSISKGVSGLISTIDGIRAGGMEPLGVYRNQDEYKDGKGYTICTVQGIKIAFVAFTKGMDGMALPEANKDCVNVLYNDYESTYQSVNSEKITAILKEVDQERPDVTVALLHWGSEYNDTISPSQERIVRLLQENGVDAIIGTHPHYVQEMKFDPEAGTFVAYSVGDLVGDGDRAGTEYGVILDLEITKDNRNGNVAISNYSYTPIFIVTDDQNTVQVVRIPDAMKGFECYFIGRVTQQTYDDMVYALQRIEARTSGNG